MVLNLRQVKCRVCSKKNDIDKAFKYEHITSGGKSQNWYYCTEEEYFNSESEKEYRQKFDDKLNDIMKYTIINVYSKTLYNQIQKSGYSAKEIYECLVECETKILSSLNYRKDIKDEKQRLKYVFAIIRNAMYDTTIRKRKQIKQNKVASKKTIEITTNRPVNVKVERKGILDIINKK